MPEPSSRPLPTENRLGRDLDDEYIFWDSGGDRVHVLNGTARRIYLLCDGKRTLSEVAGVIVDEFEIDRAAAEKDVQETVSKLLDLDLLRER